MDHDSDAACGCTRPRQEGTASSTTPNDPDGEKATDGGAWVVIDTTTHEQHARGLSKARAETLANEYADHIVARRERPDPHWLFRARLAAGGVGE